MVATKFSDITSKINDIFSKSYCAGTCKVEVKTKSKDGLKFTVTGAEDLKLGTIVGELKTQFQTKDGKLSFTETWDTANNVTGLLEAQNNLINGLKLELGGTTSLSKSKKSMRAGATYKKKMIFGKVSSNFGDQINLNGELVVSRPQGQTAGLEIGYNACRGVITKKNAAIAQFGADYVCAVQSSNNFNMLTVGFYQRVSPQIEAGARAVYDLKSPNNVVVGEVGLKYCVDKYSHFKGKIDNSGRVGMMFSQLVRPGFTVLLSSLVDTSRLSENAHKMGITLQFES